jgi:hypothetical protein
LNRPKIPIGLAPLQCRKEHARGLIVRPRNEGGIGPETERERMWIERKWTGQGIWNRDLLFWEWAVDGHRRWKDETFRRNATTAA